MRKIVVLVLISALGLFASALSDMAAKMGSRSWGSILLKGKVVFNTGSNYENIFDWAHNGGWDSVTQHFFFINAPAHNPTSFVIYNALADSFKPGPLWTTSYASHTYDAQTIYNPTGEFYYRPPLFNTFLKYKTGDTQWTVVPEISANLAPYEYGTALAQFPEMGGIVYVYNGIVSLFNVSTGTWRRLASGITMGGLHNLAEYNPVHKVVLFGFGNNSRDMYKLDTAGNVTKMKSPPDIVLTNINGVNICCDPISGDFLFMSADSLRAYDIMKDTWETIRKNPLQGVSRMASIPIPDHAVIAYISTYAPGFLLYRHALPVAAEVSRSEKNGIISICSSPNPVSGAFKVTINGVHTTGGGSLKLYNLLGREIETLRASGTDNSFNVQANNRTPGVYVLEWKQGERVVRSRIVITK